MKEYKVVYMSKDGSYYLYDNILYTKEEADSVILDIKEQFPDVVWRKLNIPMCLIL